MKRALLLTTIGTLFLFSISNAQNVFDATDPIIRWSSSQALGSPQNPDPNKLGLQKWVSIATNGISTGGGSWDVTSYKAYYLNTGTGNSNMKMQFRLKYPRSYSNPDSVNKKYPMAVFFHGAGEFACSDNGGYYNNEKQLVHGGKYFRDQVDQNKFDGFLIYPQLTIADGCWGAWGTAPKKEYQAVINIVDSVIKYCRGDIDRLFAYGLSAGGSADWWLAWAYPTRVAGIGPSSAVANNGWDFTKFVHIPIIFATGGKDTNPSPGSAEISKSKMQAVGGDITYIQYPQLGHAVWNNLWADSRYVPFMNTVHKANPLVFFQHNEFCPEDAIDARLGVTPGFYAYEWQKDNITIATRTNGVDVISDPASVLSFQGNEIHVKVFGTYRVRFRRTATSNFSDWSPNPVVIKSKTITQTPPITVSGLRSKVLPAPDGSTTVPLTLPDGYASYQFFKSVGEVLLSTDQTFSVGPGTYNAKVVEQFGCGALFSPDFKVVDANGSPKPDPAKNLIAAAQGQTAVRLDWNENPHPGSNETGFEIYRSTKEDGPYTLVNITAPNVVTYVDANLPSNQKFYYIVRAVNDFGAAPISNQVAVVTQNDVAAPTAPSNLRYRGSDRTSVSLDWVAATDNVKVTRYDIYVNGTKLYSTDTTFATVFGLDSLTTYTFFVKAADVAGNVSPSSNQVTGFTHRQGLSYKYYQGSWDNLPNFNSLTPNKTGFTADIDNGASIRGVSDNFAFLWDGFIYCPASGDYTFETFSDDGSKLYIDQAYSPSATALVNNDGLHGTQFRTGTLNLSRGYHRIVATFFEKTGGEDMQVWWTCSAAGITRERIPLGFYSRVTYTVPTLPSIPTSLSATAASFTKINLSWNDNSNNETGFEIVRSTTSGGTYLPIKTVSANVTSYSDSGLNASTTYYYKVRSISAGGSSNLTNFANATTQGAPAAPAVPTGPGAVALNTSAIDLTFTDASSNETGFEVWRSVTNTSNFRLAARLPAASGGQIVFHDTALFANSTYFYKVLANGTSTSSAFSAVVNAKTSNTLPVITQVRDFTMRYNTSFVLNLQASDIDGDALTFSATNLPRFATLSNVANGMAQITFNPRINDQRTVTIMVKVNDGNLGLDSTEFTMVVDANNVPVMSDIADVEMEEGDEINIPVTADDVEGNSAMFWQFTGLPSFATFTNNGNGNGNIKLAPTYASSGNYTTTVLADDGFGGWTSKTFHINVKERDPNDIIQVNLRLFAGSVPLWNDVQLQTDGTTSPPTPAFTAPNLHNTVDSVTSIGIDVISGTYLASQLGATTGNNSGVFPDNIIKDQINWGFGVGNNSQDTVKMRVYGLSTKKTYNFIFFSSYKCTGCGNTNSTTTFKIGAQEAKIKYFTNKTLTDTIESITPDASGQVVITAIGDPSTSLGGVLNALIIKANFDDGTTPSKPLGLKGKFISGSGVNLSWLDRAYNETNYLVYRSTTRGSGYTNLNPGTNLKDSSAFIDANVAPVTHYFYYVRGVNGAGQGASSDTIEVVTTNNLPKFTGLDNMFVKTDATGQEDFTVSDDPGEVLTVTITDAPSFVTLSNLGGGSYRLTATPTVDNLGWFDVTITAADDKGGSSSRVVTIAVTDKNTKSIFVKFGTVGKSAPLPWNNWLGARTANSTLASLKDENNVVTSIGITALTKWTSVLDMGHITGNNSGVVQDSVLQSGLFHTGTDTMKIRFQGLNTAKIYNVVFISSMNEGLTASAEYSSGTEKDTLEARYNTQQTANLNALVPNPQGQIQVNVVKLSPAATMYLSAVILEEVDPSITLLNPVNLFAEPTDRDKVSLTWSDRAVNENVADGYQLQRATDSLFTSNVVSINVPGKAHKYKDQGLTAGTKYWYRVRAKSGASFSDFSNRFHIITPQTIVYVNFNYAVPSVGAPWNNLEALPNFVESYPYMKDQSGATTNVSLEIVATFNGEFNAGKQTGNNSGIVPDNVLAANYWLDNTQLSQIQVSGLNHLKRYRFGFFGSSGPEGWFKGNYTATYTINDRTVYLNSWENTSKIVYISDVQPDINGNVMLNFSTTLTANYGFNGGVLIEAYDDVVGGGQLTQVNPTKLDTKELVETAGTAQAISQQGEFRIYPNPFVDYLNVDFFNASASDKISVEVFDIAGRLTYRKLFGKLAAGYNSLKIATQENKLGAGVYMVTLSANGKVVKSAKMVKTQK